MKTKRPPTTTWKTADGQGVSMNWCRTYEMTPNSMRTTTTAMAVATLTSRIKNGMV
jgi:hypothetical protein